MTSQSKEPTMTPVILKEEPQKMPKTYRVRYEIEVDAEGPRAAAQAADWYMQKPNRAYDPFFIVTDLETGHDYSINLDEERTE
jgi:hypothetical protein